MDGQYEHECRKEVGRAPTRRNVCAASYLPPPSQADDFIPVGSRSRRSEPHFCSPTFPNPSSRRSRLRNPSQAFPRPSLPRSPPFPLLAPPHYSTTSQNHLTTDSAPSLSRTSSARRLCPRLHTRLRASTTTTSGTGNCPQRRRYHAFILFWLVWPVLGTAGGIFWISPSSIHR